MSLRLYGAVWIGHPRLRRTRYHRSSSERRRRSMGTDGSNSFSSTVSHTNPITSTDRTPATSSSGSGPTPSDSLSADQICLPTSNVRVWSSSPVAGYRGERPVLRWTPKTRQLVKVEPCP
jgi:hypothetical protein